MGAGGDANLRSRMNRNGLQGNSATNNLLKHYQKLGKFRANHPAVGAGVHQMISNQPYYFSRILSSGNLTDKVIIGLDVKEKLKEVNVAGVFAEGNQLRDFYSGATMPVIKGKVSFSSNSPIVLLEKIN